MPPRRNVFAALERRMRAAEEASAANYAAWREDRGDLDALSRSTRAMGRTWRLRDAALAVALGLPVALETADMRVIRLGFSGQKNTER